MHSNLNVAMQCDASLTIHLNPWLAPCQAGARRAQRSASVAFSVDCFEDSSLWHHPPAATLEGGPRGDGIAYRDPDCISNLEEFMNRRNGITTETATPSRLTLLPFIIVDPQFTRSAWNTCRFLACKMCLDPVFWIVYKITLLGVRPPCGLPFPDTNNTSRDDFPSRAFLFTLHSGCSPRPVVIL
jgi:hypothetical protein